MVGLRAFVITATSVIAALGARPASTPQTPPPARAAEETPRELYRTHCATCHGETGDGKGVTVLERPARSFKDGGFSYGNTKEALLRTITHGIPGSLMPSFGTALNESQRRALADHVLALGPPTLEVEAKDTVMVVRDRAVVARGKLPPVTAGAPDRPRGLVIGVPAGLSFEYRVDDVRLLSVRSGEFVDRRDWIGRGGDYLQPLGRSVRVVPSEVAPFSRARTPAGESVPLRARLVSTVVDGPAVTLAYDLVTDADKVVARVLETPESIATPLGAGWKRTFALDRRDPGLLSFRVGASTAVHSRIDDRTVYELLAAGAETTFDLTIARERMGAALSESAVVLSEAKAITLTPKADLSSWVVFEIPAVSLPPDTARHGAVIEEFARSLP